MQACKASGLSSTKKKLGDRESEDHKTELVLTKVQRPRNRGGCMCGAFDLIEGKLRGGHLFSALLPYQAHEAAQKAVPLF